MVSQDMEAESIQKLLFAQKDQKMVQLSVLPQRVRASSLWWENKVSRHKKIEADGPGGGRSVTGLIPPMSLRTGGCPGPPCLQHITPQEVASDQPARTAEAGATVTAQLISFCLRGADSANPGPGGQGQRQTKVPRTQTGRTRV